FDVSSDGRYLAYVENDASRLDIGILPLAGDQEPFLFLQSEFAEVVPRFSPDGKWLAYVSNESGRFEVYVVPFPGPGRKWQISTAGGSEPHWRDNGKEIYYVSLNQQLMAVEVRARGDTFEVRAERALFEVPPASAGGPGLIYDTLGNGKRFLINTPGEVRTNTPLTLVVNWIAELPDRK
ncbi:hypothetical protein MYX77_11540, partial [Acidobacteriia bacterium AH_259_A11_L15]|nr:hypothetical protein [Acidobacteriia bacterium AH_259_A11_L15]